MWRWSGVKLKGRTAADVIGHLENLMQKELHTKRASHITSIGIVKVKLSFLYPSYFLTVLLSLWIVSLVFLVLNNLFFVTLHHCKLLDADKKAAFLLLAMKWYSVKDFKPTNASSSWIVKEMVELFIAYAHFPLAFVCSSYVAENLGL